MILSEVVNLLNLLRELAGRKAELDRIFFDRFVEPIWGAFTAIHQDYKDSFNGYISLVVDETNSIDDIVDRLRTDSINSEDLRANLRAMMRYLPLGPFNHTDKLETYLHALCLYFTARLGFTISDAEQDESQQEVRLIFTPDIDHSAVRPEEWLFFSNLYRYRAIIYLSRQGSSINRAQAKQLFEVVIKDLQKRYESVASNYYAIKKEMLT